MTTTDVHELTADITARLYAYHAALMEAADDAKNPAEDAAGARNAAADIIKCAWSVSRRMGTQALWGHVDSAASRGAAPAHVVRSIALAQAHDIKIHRKEQGR